MSLEFRQIAYKYGKHQALADINLIAPTGAITCLLGASGCGKTTLLNLAAGILAPQQGSIHVGDTLLADAHTVPPPEKRPVGLVFQNGALFPHMTIAENIGFGLGKGKGKDHIVDTWLSRIELDGQGHRFPNTLSGGQQQRVALARAMAPQPEILLLDEPFASVDMTLRRSLRRDCRRLLKERSATAIMVTHDPEEAMDMGDYIALMEAGRIVQMDTPARLYDAPVSAQVAMLFGDAQVLAARVSDGQISTPFGAWPMNCLSDPESVANSSKVDLILRKGALTLSAVNDGLTVQDVRRSGALQEVTLANAQGDRIAVTQEGTAFAFSEDEAHKGNLGVMPRAGSVLAFPADS